MQGIGYNLELQKFKGVNFTTLKDMFLKPERKEYNVVFKKRRLTENFDF